MKISTNPVKGTVDYLPADMEIRQQAINSILATYKSHGFLQVKTPILENLEWLVHGDSGDNQKLMFKTIKRGEKLDLSKPNLAEADVVEEGLRYDLTVPLARLFAGNREQLVMPFKAIQIDESFRAEKPQRGRNRQFTQCDIDIWGDPSIFAETEIMIASIQAYKSVGIRNIVMKVNDRRALADIICYVGFSRSDVNKVCVSLDKLDKIGPDRVAEELVMNFEGVENISYLAKTLVDIIVKLKTGEPKDLLRYGASAEVVDNLQTLIAAIKKYTATKVVFDITVVRGQGYYTGTVFECYSADGDFNRAIGGGGRYDKMLENFLGTSVPAVGYSIGLDTVVLLLKEAGKKTDSNKIALVYPKNADLYTVFDAKTKLLDRNFEVSVFAEPKNYKNFCEKLKNNNFVGIIKLDKLDTIISL